MNQKLPLTRLALALLLVVPAATASAYPRFARSTNLACATCHANPAGGPEFTEAGKAFKADSTKVPAANVEGSAYVSNQKCRVCHIKEYKSWQETPHAKALDVLKQADAAKVAEMAGRLGVKVEGAAADSPVCLSCHVTGYKLPGGFPAADSVRTAALSAVTCESCHGPGGKHVAAERAVKKTVINKQISEATCRQCHTPTMSPKFDFAAYKAKGVHEVFKPAQ